MIKEHILSRHGTQWCNDKRADYWLHDIFNDVHSVALCVSTNLYTYVAKTVFLRFVSN